MITTLYRAGADVAGWRCWSCGSTFEHSPGHRAPRRVRTFCRLALHKVFRWHRPWSWSVVGRVSITPNFWEWTRIVVEKWDQP